MKTISNIVWRIILLAASIWTLYALYGCSATRVITTTSSHTQKGDTTIIIQTKTTEEYHSKKNN